MLLLAAAGSSAPPGSGVEWFLMGFFSFFLCLLFVVCFYFSAACMDLNFVVELYMLLICKVL